MDITDNRLCFAGHSAEDLCETFGTPLYIYEEERIRQQYRRLVDNFKY